MYNLTTPQQNIWNLQKTFPNTGISNLCGAVFWERKIEKATVEKAINRFIELQSGMRLQFREENAGTVQYITEYEYVDFPFIFFNNRAIFERYAQDFAKQPFKMTDSPMYRFLIFELNGISGVLACLNHLISDAWTFSLLAKGVYNLCLEFESNVLQEHESHNYAEFIEAERKYLTSERCQKDETYWTEVYSEKPESCPIKLINKPVSVPTAQRFSTVLTAEQTEKINCYCSENNVSQAALFETAVFAYLSRVNSENKQITIGIPVLNRKTKSDKSTVGMYISTTPLTVEVSAEDTAAVLINRITDTHSQVFRHQRYPYSNILTQIRQKHQFSGNLYDVMVSFQNARTEEDITTKWFTNGYSEVPFVLHIDNRDSADSYTLNVDYQTELFRNAEEVHLLVERLMLIIDQIIENPEITVSEIDIIPAEEYQKVIFDFNNTAIDYPRDKCIHELFSEQAVKTPDKIALVFEDKKFTYRQIDEMSNSLAHYLREEKGIKPNDIVPIISKRSWHVIVAMLGVLKAGGAYMPVDPAYPVDRIEYMISEVKATIALTCGFYDTISVSALDLEKFDYSCNYTALCNVNYSDDKCYLLFTSGTTGKPKATIVNHQNLANFVNNNNNNKYQCNMLNTCHTVLALTTYTFDISVFEIYLSLLNCLTVVMSNEQENLSASQLAKLIEENDVDVIHSTPTKMLMYLEDEDFQKASQRLKMMMIGAETFTEEFLDKIKKYTDAVVYNGYGPTETTIGVSFKRITDKSDITIGKPIANTQIYILDKDRNPLPIGVAGELCISGDGVGKGYLNRPELTAEKFIPNPFIEGKTMYCTGDLARWRADGELEYLGRIDTQVKIRGLRIELGEIESVMSSFEGIRLTAVTDKRDENNRQYLVGYYTAEKEIDEKELRQHLSAKLPKYMVPNYFVHLVEMPMTVSGKTDRKNLPLPDFTQSKSEYIAPETETEKSIAAIWSKLLNVENVGRNDDFYDLGGDSLLAISLLNHLENTFGVEISMKDILENTVLENLAKYIDNAGRKTQKIAAKGADRYVLLPQQKAIYAVCSKNPQTLMYNMPARIALDNSIDRERLKDCFRKVVNAHRSLKTYIKSENDEIYGIYDSEAELHFEEYSDSDISGFIRPFDLGKAPLMRIGFTETSMLFDMHHIIADGESLNIILRDLAKLYFGEDIFVNDVQYADYADYFHKTDFSAHKAYFKDMLKCDFEPTVLPEKKHVGESAGISKLYQLDSDTFAMGREYARENGLTETMLFLGVYGILLSKYTAKTEVLSSIILTNRTHRETQNIVGMFVNTLPVMMKASGTVSEYFANVKQLVLNLFEYQELPFFEAAEAAGMTDKSVINTSFVYQADGEKKLSVGNTEISPEFIDTHTSKFDLTFELTPNESGCMLRIEYNSGKYEEELIDRLFAAYIRIISQLDKENISDISVLSEEEYQKVIFDFNDTAVDYPRDKCVHELFEKQVCENANKIALIANDKTLTYSELNNQANCIAHALIERGIKTGDIVAFSLPRKSYLISMILGIIKTGAAYLPIETDCPVDRIECMLSDSKAKFFVTEKNIDGLMNHSCSDNPNVKVISDDLCYCTYTSGTTGNPKGVLISHKNVVNFSEKNVENSFQKYFMEECDVIIASNSVAFDITLQEIHLPLLCGKSILLIHDKDIFDTEYLKRMSCDIKFGLIITPTKLEAWMNDSRFCQIMSVFSVIMCGAEMFPNYLIKKVRMYTSATIFNGYGPTETTCGSLYSKIYDDNNITIGKPIANTQIYILDKDRKPLPIGVAGELCISGDGVGKGYLNRPELTAEKFIPNPFIEGKTMYCTGDLARWRADGELEYLGRIDTQVKIRGLRIELGEVESVMSSFDGIRLTAVTDKRDENNRQYLVGYYTAETEIDEKELCQHLSAKLPKYMVPNYFVHLAEMPMTASGKTDRRNLPLPDFTQSKSEYIAPESETEIKLCKLLENLFGIEQVGVTDDFFELGGDSLKAIEYIAKAHNLGIEINLQEVFDYPSVRELCIHIENGTESSVLYTSDDFEKYEEILSRNVLDVNSVPQKKSLGNILLTGATGFLGVHILDAFMREESGTVYCLVRGGEEKLKETLHYYFDSKYDDEIGQRIIPVVGDITNELLSNNIPNDVQTVIHTAATVKHYGSYQYFHEVNVQGTKNVIAYAERVGAKLIHISTISVSGNSFADAFTVYRSEEEKHFDEQSLYIGQELDNVYVRSKFEAEMAVLDAILEGLNAKIVRVGNLTNRASDFKFQPNYAQNAFLTRIKAALEFGQMPEYLIPLYAEFSPIDETAEGVIRIAQYAEKQNVFHLNSNKPIYFDRLLEVLKKLGIPMKVVSGEQFSKVLQEYAKHSETEHIYEAFQNDMDENSNLVYDSNIRIINDFTVQFLKNVGFEWSQIDYAYIKGYVEYFRNLGYLEVQNEE